MNIFTQIRNNIIETLEKLEKDGKIPSGLNTSRLVAEPPRDVNHGDAATNAAMILAGQVGMKPRDFAEILAAELKNLPIVDTAEVAGPGFVNLRLSKAFWDGCLKNILEKGEAFGSSDIGKGQKKNVEFVSANPTGPMHIANITLMMPGHRLTCWPGRFSCGTKRRWANKSGKSPKDFIPANT